VEAQLEEARPEGAPPEGGRLQLEMVRLVLLVSSFVCRRCPHHPQRSFWGGNDSCGHYSKAHFAHWVL
jgi:hypothetical protein